MYKFANGQVYAIIGRSDFEDNHLGNLEQGVFRCHDCITQFDNQVKVFGVNVYPYSLRCTQCNVIVCDGISNVFLFEGE